MSEPTKSIPQNPPKTPPTWRAKLHARGITDQAIDRAGIKASRAGWLYPIAPDVTARRWKAFPGNQGAKYRWQPSQPDNARFYDPTGDLADHIAAANGVLILAGGEADVWVLWSAGIYNATCTLHGEGTIPPWFIDALHRLNVVTVQAWPDRDQAGMKHAGKVAQTLHDQGIALEGYTLPYDLGTKADLNTLWLDCGRERAAFVAALESCAALDLPDPVVADQPPQRHDYQPSVEITNLRDQYCTDYVERAAVTAWNIAPPNGKNFSRKNFSSPLRDDRNPSAQWNYSVHGFTDYGAGGEFFNADQVADLLGLQSWDDFKADHAPQIDSHKSRKYQPVEPEIIETPRHYENGIPHGIRELLNNWHNNRWVHIEGDDVPRLDGIYTYWEVRHDLIFQWKHAQERLERAMWVDAELDALWGDYSVGYDRLYELELELSALHRELASLQKLLQVSSPEGALSAHELASLNRFGLSYKMLHTLENTELFTFLFPYRDQSLYTGKETSTISAGRPTAKYELPNPDDFWDRFFDHFRAQMWRALLVEKYPDLPVDLLEFDDLLLAMDELQGIADYDGIGAINDLSHELLVRHDERLREALAELDSRIATLRRLYIDVSPAPYMIAPGATFTKTSQHKDLHLAITIQRDNGEIEDRYAATRSGGWTLPAYRAALKRAEKLLSEKIVTVPNFTERGTITVKGESVTAACEAKYKNAYMRGRIKLHAPNGQSVTVSPGYAKHFDYDEWLAENGGSAEIHVWDHSIDKLESLETDYERANRKEVSKRQKAINQRRDYETEAEARSERASEPGRVDQWVHHQGVMRAELFNVNSSDPHIWRAIFEKVRATDEQTKAAITAHEAQTEYTEVSQTLAGGDHGSQRRSETNSGSYDRPMRRSEGTGNRKYAGNRKHMGTGENIDRGGNGLPVSEDSSRIRVHERHDPPGVNSRFGVFAVHAENRERKIAPERDHEFELKCRQNDANRARLFSQGRIKVEPLEPAPAPTGKVCECGQPATGMIANPPRWCCPDCQRRITAETSRRLAMAAKKGGDQ